MRWKAARRWRSRPAWPRSARCSSTLPAGAVGRRAAGRVHGDAVYCSTTPRHAAGCELRLVDITDTDGGRRGRTGAALVWVESPTNPLMGDRRHPPPSRRPRTTAGALVAVDNTFATPLLQQPLALGADIVVHSATKFIAGHSDVLLGAVVTADDGAARAPLHVTRTLLGAILGPMEAFLALRGLRSLPVRLEQAQAHGRRARRATGRAPRRAPRPLSRAWPATPATSARPRR